MALNDECLPSLNMNGETQTHLFPIVWKKLRIKPVAKRKLTQLGLPSERNVVIKKEHQQQRLDNDIKAIYI